MIAQWCQIAIIYVLEGVETPNADTMDASVTKVMLTTQCCHVRRAQSDLCAVSHGSNRMRRTTSPTTAG